MTDSELASHTAAAPAAGWDPRRWLGLLPLLLAVFMDMLDNQIVAVALPTIQRHTHAAGSALQWITVGYTLAYAVLLMTGGRLGDRFGRKPAFLAGAVGFTCASLLAGLAPTPEFLIIVRVVQGGFAGVMVPQVMSYVQTEFPPEEMGKAFGLFGITFPIGGACGPLLGGLLTHADIAGWGWRSIFLVNVPVGAFTVIMAAIVMPARRPASRIRIDVLGVLLFALPLVSLLYPLIQGWQKNWPTWTFIMMVATVPLLGIFAASQRHRERRGEEPLIRLGLLRRRGFGPSLVVAMLFFATMGTFFVATLYLQNTLGYSALKTGLTFLPSAVGIAAGNMIAMRVAVNAGPGLIRIAIGICGAGIAGLTVAVAMAGRALNPWEIIAPLVIFGFGMGMTSGKLIGLAVAEVPPSEAGSASGVVNTILQLGGAIGIALVGTVFLGQLRAGTPPQHAAETALITGLALLSAALIATIRLPTDQPAPSPDAATNRQR